LVVGLALRSRLGLGGDTWQQRGWRLAAGPGWGTAAVAQAGRWPGAL